MLTVGQMATTTYFQDAADVGDQEEDFFQSPCCSVSVEDEEAISSRTKFRKDNGSEILAFTFVDDQTNEALAKIDDIAEQERGADNIPDYIHGGKSITHRDNHTISNRCYSLSSSEEDDELWDQADVLADAFLNQKRGGRFCRSSRKTKRSCKLDKASRCIVRTGKVKPHRVDKWASTRADAVLFGHDWVRWRPSRAPKREFIPLLPPVVHQHQTSSDYSSRVPIVQTMVAVQAASLVQSQTRGDRLLELLQQLQHRDIQPEDYELLLELDESVAPKTLQKDKLESFPTRTVMMHDDTNNDLLCTICYDVFTAGDVVRTLPCKHEFHRGCLDRWLGSSSQNCPIDGLSVV